MFLIPAYQTGRAGFRHPLLRTLAESVAEDFWRLSVHRLRGVSEIPWQHSRFEKFESCTSVHLAFDRFEPVDVSFNGTIAPGRYYRRLREYRRSSGVNSGMGSLTIPELESLTIYLHELEESFIRRCAYASFPLSDSDADGLCDLEPPGLLREDHR
jgi:hypothetical protein